MRRVSVKVIENKVIDLLQEAACILRKDVVVALQKSLLSEKNVKAKNILYTILENARIAEQDNLPLCQDTGMTVVFFEIGDDIFIEGNIEKAVNNGLKKATRKFGLRNSVVKNTINRINTGNNTPAIIHYKFIKGNKIKISLMLKGFGSENKTNLFMLDPTDGLELIENKIMETIEKAGANACPPFVIGVGLGGTADKALSLAKEALFEKIGVRVKKEKWAINLEKNIIRKANKLNIGPLGFGGKITVLDVKVKYAPTHIAGLPLGININCHSLRTAVGKI